MESQHSTKTKRDWGMRGDDSTALPDYESLNRFLCRSQREGVDAGIGLQSIDQMFRVEAFGFSKICSTIMIQQAQKPRRRRWKGGIRVGVPQNTAQVRTA
jgi:hypothetical protein